MKILAQTYTQTSTTIYVLGINEHGMKTACADNNNNKKYSWKIQEINLKREQRSPSDEIVSPEHKQLRAENSNLSSPLSPSNMASSSASMETAPFTETEPNMKDIYSLLISIQETVNTLLEGHNKLASDIVELKGTVAKNNNEIKKLKEDLANHVKYIASLEKEFGKTSKVVKSQQEDLEELQISMDDLEQYTRKSSLEFRGVPEEINLSTDEIVCRIAETIGIEIKSDDIEISHRLNRQKGIKPIQMGQTSN